MSIVEAEAHELNGLEDEPWSENGHELQSLPQADGGRQAWLFLSACFMVEALTWGFPFSYGIFQAYYSHHPLFRDNATGVAAIGTTQTGVMYFSGPAIALTLQRFPQVRRKVMWAAVVWMVISLIAASFCNSVAGLLVTQGVMYGLGGLTLYVPCIQYTDEWFIKRKGMAFGIMWAGTGSAGVTVPFLLQWLLDSYGFRTALRVWAIVMVIGLVPCLVFVKGRLPVTSSNARRPVDLGFVKHPAFWLFLSGSIMQSLAQFIPPLWIPSFAVDIGLPKLSGTIGLSLINLANGFGAVLLGMVVDRYHVTVPILVSAIGQMIATFLFWGLTDGQPMLYVFALAWGMFGGGFSATWSGYATTLDKKHPNVYHDTGLILALMGAGRGVGAVISGPMSERLLNSGWSSDAGFAYGTAYGILIIFSGVSAMLSATACIGRPLKLM